MRALPALSTALSTAVSTALSTGRRGLRQYVGDLRASRAFLVSEVSHRGWLDLGRVRWRDATPARAARAAFGVVVPLAIGIATKHVEYGAFAALGAQPAGVVSFQGVTRSRILAVAVAVAGMTVSTFVGASLAHSVPWLLVPAVALWAYAAGVCAALGPSAVVVSLQWPVALLIASAIPLSPEQALIRAGLVLAGGLFQGVLVITSWAVSHGATERTAMADSYAALSQYAASLAATGSGPPSPAALPGTRALRDPNPLMRNDARRHLSDLMTEAERIRTTLAVVAGPVAAKAADGQDAARTADDGNTAAGNTAAARTGGPGGARGAHLTASAGALGEIAQALRSRSAGRAVLLDRARQYLDHDSQPAGHSWTWAGESLDGQLRSAIRITDRLNDAEPSRGGRPSRTAVRPPTHDLLITLRANLGTSSEAGRHALRLAVVTGLAAMIARAAGLPHAYWAALTVLIVLRPDYSSTLYRGVQRASGTVLGVGLGLATVLLGHLGSAALLAGVAGSLFAAYALLTVNYLFFAVFLTDFVVVLLALLGLPADQTAPDRLIGTALGTGLGLLAYILWPTWERTGVSEKFARLFSAQCRFAALMLTAYSRPPGEELARARTVKLAARRARGDAEDAADRIVDEPERPPMTHALAQALVSSGHRLAVAVLAVEAAARQRQAELRHTEQPGPDPAQPRLDQLAEAVRQAGTQLAEALHRLGPPGRLPPLRELQSQIPADSGGSLALFAATDSLVDALYTTADVLRHHLAPPQKSQHDDHGRDPAGRDPAGRDPAGRDPTGHEPGGHDPGGHDPGWHDPG
jgi:Fusaric acid resistance protein-like